MIKAPKKNGKASYFHKLEELVKYAHSNQTVGKLAIPTKLTMTFSREVEKKNLNYQ